MWPFGEMAPGVFHLGSGVGGEWSAAYPGLFIPGSDGVHLLGGPWSRSGRFGEGRNLLIYRNRITNPQLFHYTNSTYRVTVKEIDIFNVK